MDENPKRDKAPKKKPVPPLTDGTDLVFTPYITIKGKRIYHPTGGVFVFQRYAAKKKD